MNLQKHTFWRRCTGCLQRVDFLKNGPLKTQVWASLYRLPPAGRFFEKGHPDPKSMNYFCFLGPKRDHLGANMVLEGILRGLRGAIGCPGRQVQFWTLFSEKMCGNPSVLHGLGAARNLKPDPPDPANPADPVEMVHSRHFGP